MGKISKQDKLKTTDITRKPNKRQMRIVSVGIIVLLLIVGISIFLTVNYQETDVIDQGVSAEEAAFNEAVANAQPGRTIEQKNDEIAMREEQSAGTTKGSKEWIENQYEIVALHRLNDNFVVALELNAEALISAKVLGDTELVERLEHQAQLIIEYREFLEQI